MFSLTFGGCARPKQPQTLTNDAYVWQRSWGEPLKTALTQSAASIRTWRVLAAEAGSNANLVRIAVNRQALQQTGKPVVAVIRIDGRSGVLTPGNQLITAVAALVNEWKLDGLPVRGIEIDYDCATNRLASYRNFLHVLRARVPAPLTLSITALPSWMGSSDLPKLLGEVNETVLQVHSVMNARKGLFDRTTAYRWAQAWSAISEVPFRLALPTYWSRVTWNEDGRLVSIESEFARHGNDVSGRELIVEPREVASLITDFRRAPVRNLVGLAWFRLPTASDERAWTLQTWRAVMLGQPLQIARTLVRFKTDETGARDVYLLNEGEVDTKLPAQVVIAGEGCEFADAVPPYDLERQANSTQFLLRDDDLLRSKEERLIGWVRCSSETLATHVSF